MHGAATAVEHAPHGTMTSTPAVLPLVPAPVGGDAASAPPAPPMDTSSSGFDAGPVNGNGGAVGGGNGDGGVVAAAATNGIEYGDAHVLVATEGTAAGDAGAWGVGIGGGGDRWGMGRG